MKKIHFSSINYNCKLQFVPYNLRQTGVISVQNAHPVLPVNQVRLIAIVLKAMMQTIHGNGIKLDLNINTVGIFSCTSSETILNTKCELLAAQRRP